MYSFLHNLLSDKKGGEIFRLFGAWHFFYIALALALVLLILWWGRTKREDWRRTASRRFLDLAFGLYLADFFLMPLAYGEIDIEKLPFHACTVTCVLCFLSYRVPCLKRLRSSFLLLGLISNLVYLIYPAGVMWHAVHPLSYRVIQTLLFHVLMTVYGILSLITEHRSFTLKSCYRDLFVLVGIVAWAVVGNYAYNGKSDHYDHFFNWSFAVRDPFYIVPEDIAPFFMPFLNIVLFFVAELLIYGLLWIAKRVHQRSKACPLTL